MSAFIAFLTAHFFTIILPLLLLIVSLLTAIFNKNEKAQGILAAIRKGLEYVSGLQPRNSAGTLKRPFSKPGPTVPDEVMKGR